MSSVKLTRLKTRCLNSVYFSAALRLVDDKHSNFTFNIFSDDQNGRPDLATFPAKKSCLSKSFLLVNENEGLFHFNRHGFMVCYE